MSNPAAALRKSEAYSGDSEGATKLWDEGFRPREARGDEPVEAIVATRPGVSRVCPKHLTSQVVTKTVLRLASAR